MKWLDEIMCRKGWSSGATLTDVGMLTVVHDTFRNDCRITSAQGFAIFGSDWQSRAEQLKRSGVLHVEQSEGIWNLKVICRGDDRRKKLAEAQKRFRCRQVEISVNKKDHTK